MEKVVFIDNCMICGISVGDNKNELTSVTSFSQKTIFQLIEEFTNTYLAEEIVNEAGVCNDCLDKFNEYDKALALASQIQQEIVSLFDLTVNGNNDVCKGEEIDDEAIVYETPEDTKPREIFLHDALETEETDQPVEIDVVEVDFLDTESKLPRAHIIHSPEEKVVFPKPKAIKIENDEYTIVQIGNVKMYQCDICERSFKEKSKLKSHKLIHTTERNVVCPLCGKSFKTQACLRSHKRVHNPVTIQCDYCGKTYTQKPELIKHINFVHFNRRDFVCGICNAGFGCKGHLKAHYLTHQQFRGISCEICGYSFHTRAKLQRHMRSHTGQRDYECGICHKRFLYSYNVSAHIRHVHWKEKRSDTSRNCCFCSKKFTKIWKLREHLQEEHQFIETEIVDESEIIDDSNVEMELVEA